MVHSLEADRPLHGGRKALVLEDHAVGRAQFGTYEQGYQSRGSDFTRMANDYGIDVPFLGFVDLGWTQHGIRLDIKSKLKMPTDIEMPHKRQVSLYIHDTNYTGRVAYFTPTQEMVFVLEDNARHLEELRQIAIRLQNFLALSNDREKLIASVVPNYANWTWADAYTRGVGRETFGV